MSRYFRLILSLVLAIATMIPSSSADPQLIIDTCKNIAQVEPSLGHNYQICVSFLQSDPRSQTSTLEGLAEISFELTKKKTVAIESQINTLLGNPNVDASIKKGLADCAEMYSDAEDSLQEALIAFKKKDYLTANIRTSAAEDVPSNCEDGFQGKPSPLSQANNEIERFYGIPLVFTNMFH